MRLRRWWIAALVVAILGGVGLIAVTTGGTVRCSGAAVSAATVPRVWSSTDAPVVREDPQLLRLVDAMQGPGFGRVLGAVGFDHLRYLQAAAVPGGFATWTADNAVVGFRSPAGAARWGLRQSTAPQAWALLGSEFVSLELRRGASLRAVAYRGATGKVAWCADIRGATTAHDPLTVAPGSDGSAWVISAGPTLTHLDAAGRVIAGRRLGDVDRGAFVKQIGSIVIAGGRASSLLAAPDRRMPAQRGTAVAALDVATMRSRWAWGRGLVTHVVGEADGLVIIEVARSTGLSLVALDRAGHQRWSTVLPADTTPDMALLPTWRTVLVRSGQGVTGYAIETGAPRWTRWLGNPAFPDGFDLATQPMIGSRLLLGTRSALVLLDRVGRATHYPLPVSGPDFWPYDIAVSGRHAVVATDIGAVLVALSPLL